MVQGYTEGQVDAHDPVLGRAREVPIHDVRNHAKDPVDMQTADGTDREWNIPNLEAWESAILEEADYPWDQDESPSNDQRDVEFPESIQVDIKCHGVPIGENHDGE